MASRAWCCLLSSNTFVPPCSLTTSSLSPASSLVLSAGLKSRRASSVVTRAAPGLNTYIFAFVFPLSLLVATIFTTIRISDKLDEDFLQELAVNQAILEASEEDEDDGTSTEEPERPRTRNRPKREAEVPSS